MTDPTVPDSQDTSTDDTADGVDQDLDTTSGDRDPLSTDGGLAQAATQMPSIGEDRPADDGRPVDDIHNFGALTLPGLDLENDGTDPLAELGKPGTEVA